MAKDEEVPALEIEAAPRKSIPVRLVGVMYEVTPPKAGMALRIASKAKGIDTSNPDDFDAAMELIDEWMVKAFGKKNAKAIRERMEDDDDALDFPHLTTLMEKLITMAASGNPTS